MEISEETCARLPLFNNRQLDSIASLQLAFLVGRMPLEMLRLIIQEMVLLKQADWLHNTYKSETLSFLSRKVASERQARSADIERALILWRTPSEWAESIYSHLQQTGQLGTILTVNELFYAEDSSSSKEEFHGLPESMWRRALKILQDRGKAQLFDSEEVSNNLEMGIKFF